MSKRYSLVPTMTQQASVDTDGSRTIQTSQRFGANLVTTYTKEFPECVKVRFKGTPGTVTTFRTSCPSRTHNVQPLPVPSRIDSKKLEKSANLIVTINSKAVQGFGGHQKQNILKKTIFIPAPPLLPSSSGPPGEPLRYYAPEWLTWPKKRFRNCQLSNLFPKNAIMDSDTHEVVKNRCGAKSHADSQYSPKHDIQTAHHHMIWNRTKRSSSW